MSRVQFYPNRIAITPDREPRSQAARFEAYFKKIHGIEKFREVFGSPDLKKNSLENLKKQNHPFVLSPVSRRKLQDSINSMYCLSKPRTVWRRSGKPIYNFRCAFVTLTLPAAQRHSDTTIKKECLNQYLTELRQRYDIKNYVWKAELQDRGAIHFHIVFDKFLDYKVHRWIWNRCISKLGYIERYSEKMSSLSIQEYARLRGKNTIEIIQAYERGVETGWANPNTVDVKSVRNDRDLSVYMAKYVSKNEAGCMVTGSTGEQKRRISIALLDRERKFGRSWSRSYSLAKLKFLNKFSYVEIRNEIRAIRAKKDAVFRCIGDFYEVLYFQISKMPKWFSSWHSELMKQNAIGWNYPFPA